MKFPTVFALNAILLLQPASAGDTLVQVSTIDALMKGIYDGACTFETLKKHGDFGIGTLDNLDGEMLAIDGRFFQITSDGIVHSINDKAETPFSDVTFFKSDKTASIGNATSLATLQALLDAQVTSQNLFYAIRITGEFPMMSLRSVPKQTPPYVPLTEAAKHQTLFKLENVRGTLVGFRCPTFVKGINVPGYHFHFISEDRKSGGHVLDCAVTSATADLDVLENLKVLLPQDEPFLKADFTTHDEKALDSVEKSAPAK